MFVYVTPNNITFISTVVLQGKVGNEASQETEYTRFIIIMLLLLTFSVKCSLVHTCTRCLQYFCLRIKVSDNQDQVIIILLGS